MVQLVNGEYENIGTQCGRPTVPRVFPKYLQKSFMGAS
jgi:hypothetical protein